VEPVLAGIWGVCSDGMDEEENENRVVFGVAYDEILRFYEDGTFLMYEKNTFHSEDSVAQTSGEYRLLSVKSTATSASGEMQLILTTPAPINVRFPYTYMPDPSERNGLLLLATDGDYLPCQPCGLCQLQVATHR
jgi:hypothetical protein